MRPEWDRFKILVWQYTTSVLEDIDLYRRLGLGGFHIDRGYGKDKLVTFSNKMYLPYYVDHAADKGFLYLKGKDVEAVTGKRSPVIRPHSLADAVTILNIKWHLSRNIETTMKGMVLAYAFDDEISLGRFVSPCDVDVSPASLEWFRKWLREKYGDIKRLNTQWGTHFETFDKVMPQGFEDIRKRISNVSLSEWNLSPWMDFRHFMDFQFASVLKDLCLYANSLDPRTPAGFVGGQAPGPWGGYDYAMLSRAVQWMEAYDIHGTNEILRSFWNEDRRARMMTFFSTKNSKLDAWFLWYYMLHGNQAAIAWPEGWFHNEEGKIASYILADRSTFEEIQGEISAPIVDQKTLFDPDPIAIYYSQPSIQAGWAMDALVHGSTWVKRKSSIDNENQSQGVLRKVWCKTLEDLGYQYDFISYLAVQEGRMDLNSKFKVLILPKTVCLSEREAEVFKTFVEKGGTIIADYLCGLLDEHGKGRSKGALDDLFGIDRDESKGYMDGNSLTELDGEKYEQPFLNRFTHYNGAYHYNGIVIFERGTRHTEISWGKKIKGVFGIFHRASVLVSRKAGKGMAVYLNLSPLEYWAPEMRFSNYGMEWRKTIGTILSKAGLSPRVKVFEKGNPANMIESLWWKNGDRYFLGLVKNPTEKRGLPELGDTLAIQGITGEEVEIQMEFQAPINLINLRTNEHLGKGHIFQERFKPWEGNLYEVTWLK